MPEIVIRNFKFGLDTRRSELTSQPGTLAALTNAHINQGGEAEKRYAFTSFSDLSAVDSAGDRAFFGLEATEDGLITFTHCTSVSSTFVNNQTKYRATGTPIVTVPTVTVPPSIHAYRLYHPATLDGMTGMSYDRTKHRLTAANVSRVYDGKALVAATFADGNTFLYYDGDLVMQSVAGTCFSGFSSQANTNDSLRRFFEYQVYNEFPDRDWLSRITTFSAVGVSFPFSQPDTKSIWLSSPVATTFTSVVSKSSSSGKITNFTPGLTGTKTAWTLSVTPGGGSNTWVVTDVDTSETWTILNAFDFTGAGAGTLGSLVAAINQVAAITGVTAVVNGVNADLTKSWEPLLEYEDTPTAPTLTINGGAPTNFTGGAGPEFGDTEMYAWYGSWAADDYWSAEVAVASGDFTLGSGNLRGIVENGCKHIYIHAERAYLTNTDSFTFSAVDSVTGWEQQDVGAGSVAYATQYGAQDTVQAFADYQGRLAVFGRRSVQIWTTNANPESFSRNQTLTEIGTMAPLSVQSWGELDVFFLHDTGVRSLRVKNSSLNAFVSDIGSPIDSLIRTSLSGLTEAQKATACSIIEPGTNRYWLYLNGVIYVLSNFPDNKIVAWSKYMPTYNNGGTILLTNNTLSARKYWFSMEGGSTGYLKANHIFTLGVGATQAIVYPQRYIYSTADTSASVPGLGGPYTITDGFVGALSATGPNGYTETSAHSTMVPEKFVVHEGRVYVRDTNKVYIYGGSAGVTYDNTLATVELPWLDDGKPVLMKSANGIDIANTGKWLLMAGMDPESGTLEHASTDGSPTAPNQNQDSSFDLGNVAYNNNGTHFKLKAISTSDNEGEAKVSCVVFNY
jgi:hypothetical protein